NGDALTLHLLGKFGKCDLYPIIDVDSIDVRIGAELERHSERVAPIVATHALHVDQLVYADDLRLKGLSDSGIHHGGGGSGVSGCHRHLGWNDVGILGYRNRVEREQARDRGHDRNNDCEARTIDEEGRQHSQLRPRLCTGTPRTEAPGRTPCSRSTMT